MIEQYKKTIQLRIILICIVLMVFVAILLFNQFGASVLLKDSIVFSFQCGFASAGALVLAFLVMRYSKALRNEEKLKLLYNQEHDERMSAIRSKAGAPMVVILSLLLVLAGMIAGYFDETVFYVLLCAALGQLLISLAVKFYFKCKL